MAALIGILSFAAIPSLAASKLVARQIMNNVAFIKGQSSAQSRGGDAISIGSCWPPVDMERAACLVVAAQMAEAIGFVRSRTAPNESIFVGLGRHDKIFVNNVAFYFMADRPPATKWYQFNPGLQTSRSVQDQMIVDLKNAAPRYVIIDTEWDNTNEPNESAVSSGVTTLDEFIARTYYVVAGFPPYFILERINN
jgi:hypothetical protein